MIEKYNLKADYSLSRFEFTGIKPKQVIRKLIEIQLTTDSGVFDLAFGD